MHYQLEDYLKENGLLYKYQSGFRELLSTNSELTGFVLSW